MNDNFVRLPGTISFRENYAICVLEIDTSNSKRLPIAFPLPRWCWQPLLLIATAMKDFSNASFPPEVISVMEEALDAAVASLPEPVHSSHVQALAEAILRAAHNGERDPIALQRLALLELRLVQR
jgi:hypothetical protein